MKFKNIIPLSLIIIPWLLFLPFLCQIVGLDAISDWLFAHAVKPVYIAFPIILIANVFCDYVCPWETAELNLWNLRVKLLLIPVYLLVFWLIQAGQGQLTMLLILCAMLLATSSAYGIRVLFHTKKAKEIGLFSFLLLLIFHFCFVTDIIAALILRRKLQA